MLLVMARRIPALALLLLPAVLLAARGARPAAFAQSAAVVRTGAIADRGLTPADFPQLKKLTDHVYVFSDLHSAGFGYMTNDMIVITTDGVLVADGQGTPAVTQKLVDRVATLTTQPITYVVVCSEHGDHTGGNVSFPSTATFISSPVSQANLRRQAAADRPGGPKTIVPTETVSDRRVLTMGTTEVQILNSGRAHTGGDLEVYLPKEKIAFLSEVYSNHIFPSMRTANPIEWIATLKKVSALDATIFLPGHGFVDDPPVLREELAAFQRAVEYVVAEAKRFHDMGTPVDAAIRQANWGPYETWTSKDRNAPIAMQRVYDDLDGKLK
jgi:glyoxylase-like metal-dependent hydrolase (beta-lactamase superfamily II)